MPELVTRILSALVLAAVAAGATLVSPWTFLLLLIAGAGIMSWEWGRLVRGEGFDPIAIVATLGAAAVLSLIALGRPGLALAALAVTAAAIGAIGLGTRHPGWSLAGFLYAALPLGALVWLRGDPVLGAASVLYVLSVVWATDSASYAAGRLIGGPKLAPSVSPNKTWSGFVVGIFAPALIGFAFAAWLGGTSGVRLALVSIALALACQMGDLAESAVKRRFGTKDMSAVIPGHGGLLDRIDGLLFAAMLAGLIALRDPAEPGRALLIW
jgi:phosphatidate cytidylyltransferase